MLYDWIRAFHIIAVVAWMAGLLYLPRLFVYHAAAPPGSDMAATFAVMERRLLRAIMNPAMIMVWLLGALLLALEPAWLRQGWLHAKLAGVLGLTAMHMLMARWRRELDTGSVRRSPRFFRIANEVPTLLLIAVVILVVVKPF